jgi:prepilin signal peptidase PulO-like enzyme (type II secretory pathway)
VGNLECPNCHQKTISLWRKMFLGPARSATCPSCGSRISVPFAAMLAVIPFLIAIIAAGMVGSGTLAAVVLVAGFLTMSWIHYKFIPLIVK